MVGSSITYADIALFHLLRTCAAMNATSLEAFPTLAALKDRVAAIPTIAAYLASQ